RAARLRRDRDGGAGRRTRRQCRPRPEPGQPRRLPRRGAGGGRGLDRARADRRGPVRRPGHHDRPLPGDPLPALKKRRPKAALETCGGKRPARCRRRRTVELYFLTNPIFCMWAFLAAASTLASTPYSASSLMSISSVGWLLMSRWTSASIIWRRADNGVGLSFQ